MSSFPDFVMNNAAETTDELIRVALATSDELASDDALWALRRMGSMEVFERAQALTLSKIPKERELGVQILCQFKSPNYELHDQSTRILVELLAVESNVDVLCAIGWGLGHLSAAAGVAPLCELTSHSDPRVRLAVVGGLLRQESENAIEALIILSQDNIPEVRSWATFALAQQIDADTPKIRKALYARLSDEDGKTYVEAVYGLARRKDKIVIEILSEWLLTYSGHPYDLQAACDFGDSHLLPALLQLQSCPGVEKELLEEAIHKCTEGQS
jgi:HEAT repeat protein